MALKCVLPEMNRIEFRAWSFQVSNGSCKVLEKENKNSRPLDVLKLAVPWKSPWFFGQCGPENYLASPLVAMHLLLVSYPCRVNRATNCLITDNIWKAVWHGHYGVLFCYQHAMTPKMMLKWFWFLGFTCPEKVLIFIVTFEWEPWVVSWCQ